MPTPVRADDVTRMTDALFIEKSWKSPSASKFWVLLLLATVIATAGVIADSTATVIGAMIVAPLMTPILGIAARDRARRQAGAPAQRGVRRRRRPLVIAVAWLISQIEPARRRLRHQHPGRRRASAPASSTCSRPWPRARSARSRSYDATSATPCPASRSRSRSCRRWPSSECSCRSGATPTPSQALLLFGTNVAAIIATGTIVLALYRVRDVAQESGQVQGGLGKGTIAVIGALVVIVMVPLGIGTAQRRLRPARAARRRRRSRRPGPTRPAGRSPPCRSSTGRSS